MVITRAADGTVTITLPNVDALEIIHDALVDSLTLPSNEPLEGDFLSFVAEYETVTALSASIFRREDGPVS